jgi:hypothetical protein
MAAWDSASHSCPNRFPRGHPTKKKTRNPLGLRAFRSSRGGTRTRDLGIMSENAMPSDLDSTSDDAA